jgi:hypothetical protein
MRQLVRSDEETLEIILEAIREAPNGTINERLGYVLRRTKGSCSPAVVLRLLQNATARYTATPGT